MIKIKKQIKKKSLLPQGSDYHRHGKYYMQYLNKAKKVVAPIYIDDTVIPKINNIE
jgi:hypothetical protein|tara:strand:- start:28 stop:195 length:168 start_codon:yes stop_codon:yes gene_type:complete